MPDRHAAPSANFVLVTDPHDGPGAQSAPGDTGEPGAFIDVSLGSFNAL
jgi:hypothetical protein